MIDARFYLWSLLTRFVFHRRRCLVISCFSAWITIVLIFMSPRFGLVPLQPPTVFNSHLRPPSVSSSSTLPPLAPRLPCLGPRGHSLFESPDDELQPSNLTIGMSPIPFHLFAHDGRDFHQALLTRFLAYPVPFLGSHRELGIDQTWMTADGRYGPYGFGEERSSYKRSIVDWDSLDWAQLQDDCIKTNSDRFPGMASRERYSVWPKNNVRLTWRNQTQLKKPTLAAHPRTRTRRTALVLRAFSSFYYKPEDLWNIRSLIVEAALRSGGEYTVFLLVHVQDREKNVFASQRNYDLALDSLNLPPELRSISLLWDDHLLESWYEAVEEHRLV